MLPCTAHHMIRVQTHTHTHTHILFLQVNGKELKKIYILLEQTCKSNDKI